MKKVLFVSWDGPDSPYLETLFLPVFRELAGLGFQFQVLQFTWGSKEYVRGVQQAATAARVGYTSFPILRGPAIASAIAMIAAGAAAVRAHAKRFDADIVMPRSIMPAAMALMARRSARWSFAFDADGLAADERVEFANWNPAGTTYRVWREIEAQALRVADVVVTRTEAAKPILLARAGAATSSEKIFVIPNARDPRLFFPGSERDRRDTREEWGVPPRVPCVIFAGSVGPQYYPNEMISLYARILERRDDAHMVLLSHNLEELRALVRRVGIHQGRVILRSVRPSAIPRQLAAADLGLALRARTFSQRAVSPTKVGEYLLCGVPVLATPVGDIARQLEESAGLIIDEPTELEIERAAAWFVDCVSPLRERYRDCAREIGLRTFGIERAVQCYADALGYAIDRRAKPKA